MEGKEPGVAVRCLKDAAVSSIQPKKGVWDASGRFMMLRPSRVPQVKSPSTQILANLAQHCVTLRALRLEHSKSTEHPNRPKKKLIPSNLSARKERTSQLTQTLLVGS